MVAGINSITRRLNAVHSNFQVADKRIKQADRIRAASHTGDQRIWQSSRLFKTLLTRLAADDRLEVTHHGGIGMWPCNRPNYIKGIINIGHPITHRLIQSVFQCF